MNPEARIMLRQCLDNAEIPYKVFILSIFGRGQEKSAIQRPQTPLYTVKGDRAVELAGEKKLAQNSLSFLPFHFS